MDGNERDAEGVFRQEAVLILAPDAALSRKVLEDAGMECAPCRDIGDLCAGIDDGAGIAVLAEEALAHETLELLRLAIRRQPAWSDFPLLVVTAEGADSELVLHTLETLGNVTLLQRPVRVPALVSGVRAALRARRRQYQIRDYVGESDRIATALREADRRKDEFLAILAHELRNPLAPLRNALEALRLKPHDREAAAWARAVMERQVAQMVRLIDDLLDLSRVGRGRIELRHERSDMASLVNGALEICGAAIKAGGHKLTLDLPGEALPLSVDPTRIVQVICNLISNAAKYTPPGGRISVSVRKDSNGSDSVLELSVRDTGIGIPQDMLQKVFDMFTQVTQSMERSQGGLGIGLTLVKRLVELHGGTVEARSAGPGRGSEFVVRLPEHPEAAVPMRVAALPQAATPAAGRRILVADDNRDAADSLAFMLRLAGHEVRIAYDGQQAIDMAEAFRPALALIDIGMPRLNGCETARRLRAKPYGETMLLIALTGWGQPDDRNRSLAAGFDHHIVKPVDPSMLERLLAAPAKKKGPACRGEDGPRGGVQPARPGLLQGASGPELR
jgi:signal transduction histidine kinase/ActR/RegA family two-component response regulator